ACRPSATNFSRGLSSAANDLMLMWVFGFSSMQTKVRITLAYCGPLKPLRAKILRGFTVWAFTSLFNRYLCRRDVAAQLGFTSCFQVQRFQAVCCREIIAHAG